VTSGNLVAIADNALENAQGELTPVTQCYAYNGLNRLESAWTITGSGSGCASSSAGNSASLDTSATKYASAWEYSTAGRVTSVSDLLASTSRAYDPAGVDPANPAAVHTITNPDIPAIPAVPAVPPSEENPEGVAEIPAVPAVPVAADTFTYDALGRMTERVTHVADPVARTVTAHTLALTWDASSNLVKTIQDGHTVVYVYDSSGQRVAQIGVTAATATAYLGATELTDPNTGVNATVPADLVGASFITGTRYYTLGGATVAVRQAPTTASPTDKLSFLFGDVQGSAEVMVTHTIDANGALSAITADSVHRNAYTPYGATRGSGTIAENDNLTISKGWLNQVSDEASTGLVYLNARYYDPLVSRFLSPDPQMNPSDPRTLDAYVYANDNPIAYFDPTGLFGLIVDGGARRHGSVEQTSMTPTTAQVAKISANAQAKGEAKRKAAADAAYKAALDKAGLVLLADGSTGCKNNQCYYNMTNYTNPLAKPDGGYGDKSDPNHPISEAEYYFQMAFLTLLLWALLPPAAPFGVAGDATSVATRGGTGAAETAADGGLSSDLAALAESNVTNSGSTVLGSYPRYIEVAQGRGASYFDIGDAWNGLSASERTAANNLFLDGRMAAGDTFFLTTPRGLIDSGSQLADEVAYVTRTGSGYHWVYQWSIAPGG